MSALEIVIGILVILVSIAVIAMIMLQQSRRRGVNGVISGGADTFLSKNKARTADAFLSKWTKILAAIFFVLALAGNAVALLK